MTSDKDNLIFLDFYRRNWCVGFVYCTECEQSGYQMWVSGAELINCPHCDARIPLSLQEE